MSGTVVPTLFRYSPPPTSDDIGERLRRVGGSLSRSEVRARLWLPPGCGDEELRERVGGAIHELAVECKDVDTYERHGGDGSLRVPISSHPGLAWLQRCMYYRACRSDSPVRVTVGGHYAWTGHIRSPSTSWMYMKTVDSILVCKRATKRPAAVQTDAQKRTERVVRQCRRITTMLQQAVGHR